MKREIEIKYLLDDQQARDQLVAAALQRFPDMKLKKSSVIISFFYKKPPAKNLETAIKRIVDPQNQEQVVRLIRKSGDLVVKARSIDDTVYFAVKGSPAGQDAVHAVSRLEFEVAVDISLDELGHRLEESGVQLVSKFSSWRDFYALDSALNMDVEFVSGYGYKAEIELLVEEEDSEDEHIERIRKIAKEVGIQEASQELFGKMYHYYNQNWQEYFSTRKTFSDEVWQMLLREN